MGENHPNVRRTIICLGTQVNRRGCRCVEERRKIACKWHELIFRGLRLVVTDDD